MKSKIDPEKFFPDPDFFDPLTSPILIPDKKIRGFIPVEFWKSLAFGRKETESPFFSDPEIKQVEKLFNDFCQKVKNLRHDYTKPPKNPKIPAIIHFIWVGSPLPPEANAVINSWKMYHPGWEFKLWTDQETSDFPWSNGYVKLAFQSAKDWAEKADILRYEILYRFGGIYADLDTICLKSFNDLISNDVMFFAGLDENKLRDGRILQINNALMGASQQHPIIKYCLDNLILEAEAPEQWIAARTGPILLTHGCQEALKKIENKELLFLPCGYFFPFPFMHFWANRAITAQEIKEQYISSESMMVHLWANSWAFSIIQGRSKIEFENFLKYDLLEKAASKAEAKHKKSKKKRSRT